jgi:signal transduction histidine kinase
VRRSEKFFFVFIVIILIPSVIFAYKAYKSIWDKKDTLLLKERVNINSILNHISEKTEEELLKREKVENNRPYYEYSYYFTPEGLASSDYVIQKSPLSDVPEDKLIMGYFQIDGEKMLTTPYFFYDSTENETIDDIEFKKQLLAIVDSKAYPTLVEELNDYNPAPIKTVNQSPIIQKNYENIKQVYNTIYSATDSTQTAFRNREGQDKGVKHDIVKYYPIQYLYKKGGVFAFRKALVRNRTYIQGYVINIVHLIDNILGKFISENAPDNFSIYSYPLEDNRPYAEASISNKLNFIKLYVYKNDNSHIDSIIKDELLEYYISAFSLFAIILAGCVFIFRTIKSEAEINQKKSDFISAVTHELKSPLTSIRLYSEMLKDDMVTDVNKKKIYYDHMLKESERLTRLINNVLDFSKIENSKKVYQMVEGDLKGLIHELCDKYKNNLSAAGFEFIFDIDDVGICTFDRDAITQVFINLLDNAVKYSARSDEKKISVKLHDAQDKIILEVIDKGIGIPKGEQKAIFEKFYRIENELTRTSKGSGIGLSIVKEYVKAHGGMVEAASKERKGSRFKIVLPKVHKSMA